jgi:L,D-transpeptidase ErfK/SrfK
MIQRKIIFNFAFTLSALIISTGAYSLEFSLPLEGNDMVGTVQTIQSEPGDTLTSIGIKYDMGAHEISSTNSYKNNKIKEGSSIIIPTHFILPSIRDGVVINLAGLRLYYFQPATGMVNTFPISVGRENWETPLCITKVIKKIENPSWTVPKSILAESERKGKPLKTFYPGGPNNPLGKYAIYLDLPGIRIHGTTAPSSIGRRASHGCVRMFADDIKFLYDNVPIGTPVYFIYQVYKAGWDGHWLYLEAEKPLTGYKNLDTPQAVIEKATKNHPAIIDEERLKAVLDKHDGIPAIIGHDSSVQGFQDSNSS